ncbi:unnamed protein product [Schistosoma curassoni]|uniref:NAD(P)-binding protein n=1 Tax=Schistosoma curassoni TaxID=6186 RepID=A0A183JKD7_9TREM|nr:unnamed protein product [Schistosoma curassoni]
MSYDKQVMPPPTLMERETVRNEHADSIRNAGKADIGYTAAQLVYGTTPQLPGEFVDPSSSSVNMDLTSYTNRLNMRSVKPVSTRPQPTDVFVQTNLRYSTHVFVHRNSHRRPFESAYEGSFTVLQRGPKYYIIDRNGTNDSISIDRLKAAYLEGNPIHVDSPSLQSNDTARTLIIPHRIANTDDDTSTVSETKLKTTCSGKRISIQKHNISDAASKSISDIHFAKKLGSLLGQATCTSYPDHQIKSILCSVDVIKNNYMRSGRLRKEACETSDSIINPYVPKGHQALSDLSGLLERDVSIHLPLLEKKHRPFTLCKNNETHPSLIFIISTTAFVFSACLLFYWRNNNPGSRKSLHGFNVLITGGSSGIGLSLAKLFYGAGANVTIVARDLKKLESAREIIKCGKDRNNNVFILSVDLTSEYSVLNEIFSKHVATLGKIM